jgi:hypothetical protein
MPTQYIKRQATAYPTVGHSTACPIYCDSDDSKIKFIPGGAGSTTEVTLVDTATSQTITGTQTFTGAPQANGTIYVNDITTAAAAGSTRAIQGSITTLAGTAQTSGTLAGVRGVVTGAANISGSSVYGVQGKLVTGAFTVAGTTAAVYAQYDMTGGTIGAGNQAAIQANFVGVAAGTVNLNGLYVENAGGGAINSYARLLGNSTFVFDIESSYTNQSTSGTAGATATKGWLKIQITNGAGTVTRYIPLTDSVS